MTTQGDSGRGSAVTVGVIADPVAAPAKVADHLAGDLPQVLEKRLAEDSTWTVDVHRRQLPPSDAQHTEIMGVATELMQRCGWDLVVCVTDLPLRSGRRPIVADMSSNRRIVVVSLPAFGAMRLRRRVRNVVAQLISDMRGAGTPSEGTDEHRRRRLRILSRRFRRATPDNEEVDVRILASGGAIRLLLGMIRANRPWMLVAGLRGPLVGAFAFSAFYLVSSVVWELSSSMGLLRLLAAVVGAITVMVVWIIVYHHLWEPTIDRPAGERDEAVLFNLSTVLTLTIGVGIMYIGLYLTNLVAALVVLAPTVFGKYIGTTPGPDDYMTVALLITAAATVAGAIGSGFESEESVRAASYSYREQERRQALQDTQRRREQQESPHYSSVPEQGETPIEREVSKTQTLKDERAARTATDSGEVDMSKRDLYEVAQRLEIPGRSTMNKQQLARAIEQAEDAPVQTE